MLSSEYTGSQPWHSGPWRSADSLEHVQGSVRGTNRKTRHLRICHPSGSLCRRRPSAGREHIDIERLFGMNLGKVSVCACGYWPAARSFKLKYMQSGLEFVLPVMEKILQSWSSLTTPERLLSLVSSQPRGKYIPLFFEHPVCYKVAGLCAMKLNSGHRHSLRSGQSRICVT